MADDVRYVKVTRIYCGDDQQSHFEDLYIQALENAGHPAPTMEGRSIGFMTGALDATAWGVRLTPPGGDHDFHFSPGRAIQLTLTGRLRLEVGDGSFREFGPGDILMLDEQGQGQGHRSVEVESPRFTVNIYVPPELDLSPWRITPPA